ncbi:DUF4247 domain-containing protein [Actinomadura hibisca]|uniref:DUF4247 domain-containing protein n=1 Tax=Actinomadura hibisca TaxID=68565 RepID=UPI000833037A|nr:DUF4247 domain-containing protein [Actinomadura hibisca]
MKRALVGGGLLAAIGVFILVMALVSGGSSPKGWIARTYARTAPGTYLSTDSALRTAQRISAKYKPSDRAADPTGVYLRYPDLVVAVLPQGGKGSRITVDTAARGYARYHSSVGGRWGGPGGHASTFRGGGPGEGK